MKNLRFFLVVFFALSILSPQVQAAFFDGQAHDFQTFILNSEVLQALEQTEALPIAELAEQTQELPASWMKQANLILQTPWKIGESPLPISAAPTHLTMYRSFFFSSLR